MDGASDSVLFVNAVRASHQRPANARAWVAYRLEGRDGEVAQIKQTLPPANNEPFTPFSNADQATLDTETSRVQLLNALLILRTNIVKLDADIVSKKKEIDALTNLRATYAPGSAADFNTHDVRCPLDGIQRRGLLPHDRWRGGGKPCSLARHSNNWTTSGSC